MYDEDNKVLGTIGAIIGACLGIIVWCLIGKLGYIAWIGGLAISGLSFGGYYLLGKDFSKAGIIIVVVLIIVSVYVATRLNWAMELQDSMKDYMDMSLTDCFAEVMDMIELADAKGKFYRDLFLGYGITAISSISVLKKAAG